MLMMLKWDDLHLMSRELVCEYAAVKLAVAKRQWAEIELWLQMLLAGGLRRRTQERIWLQDDPAEIGGAV